MNFPKFVNFGAKWDELFHSSRETFWEDSLSHKTDLYRQIYSKQRKGGGVKPAFCPCGKNQHQLMPIIYLLVYTRTIEAGEKLAYYWFLVCSADLNL